jgi:sirohydrochlorin ferrochelatase
MGCREVIEMRWTGEDTGGARIRVLLLVGAVLTVAGCASGGFAARDEGASSSYGVLLMAHGGTEEWNEAVLESTSAVEADYPVEVALGMAAAGSLQEAVSELEAQGVDRIGVVRLFVSGESWYERTRQILGVDAGAPPRSEAPAPAHHGGGHHDFAATFWRVESGADFALSREGLSQADEMSPVLLDRARALSSDPERESVLILAHGPGDDAENERWIDALSRLAAPLGETLPFRAIEVHTLREDWDEKREVAEQRIRAFVETAGEDGGECLVIPFRVFGFGPYAEVLEGLDYKSDGRGLLPHEEVSAWIRRQAESLSRGPFERVLDSGEAVPGVPE